jgi:hypothetical protein
MYLFVVALIWDALLSQLLLNCAIDSQTVCVIDNQTISFIEIFHFASPIIMKCAFRKTFEIDNRLKQEIFN